MRAPLNAAVSLPTVRDHLGMRITRTGRRTAAEDTTPVFDSMPSTEY